MVFLAESEVKVVGGGYCGRRRLCGSPLPWREALYFYLILELKSRFIIVTVATEYRNSVPYNASGTLVLFLIYNLGLLERYMLISLPSAKC